MVGFSYNNSTRTKQFFNKKMGSGLKINSQKTSTCRLPSLVRGWLRLPSLSTLARWLRLAKKLSLPPPIFRVSNAALPKKFFIRIRIGFFAPLRSDCTRLRDHKKSWIVSKGQASFFYHELKLEIFVKTYLLWQCEKIESKNIINLTLYDFSDVD